MRAWVPYLVGLLLLLAGAGSSCGQSAPADSLAAEIKTRRTALMAGYVYQGAHFLRLGLGRIVSNDHIYPGKHAASAVTTTLSLNADLRIGGASFIVAPTLSWHTSFVWLLVGADLAYISNFKRDDLLLRLNVGIGFGGGRMSYGWNIGERSVNQIDAGAFIWDFPLVPLDEQSDTLRATTP